MALVNTSSEFVVSSVRSSDNHGKRYCFAVDYTPAASCDLASNKACCNFQLDKIEFDIQPACASHVTDIYINDKYKSTSYASTAGGEVFKITQLNSPAIRPATWQGATVCFTLAGSQCMDLNNFCRDGRCQYAFFDAGIKCCPVNNVFSR